MEIMAPTACFKPMETNYCHKSRLSWRLLVFLTCPTVTPPVSEFPAAS
jgi:hypothetical protein